jgi:glycosyltransferase involved in cell wall biosynthesis
LRACFFARVANRGVLERVEYYKQDLDILHELGFEVQVATSMREIPFNVDLYFIWWWQWAFLPLLKGTLFHRACVITGAFDYHWPHYVMGTDYLRRPSWQRALMRYALARASTNVFVSQHEFDMICSKLKANNPRFIPLCVDTEVYRPGPQPREDFVLTFAWLQGSNAARKCIPEMVRAIPLVRKRHPEVRFVIAGEKGTAFPELERLARDLGVLNALEFPGVLTREKKIELMQRCQVYASPSLYEGFGLAILEAMSCGAPVVSSPVGAVPEVVADAALLVDGASPGAIADAINFYLEDGALREENGRRGRTRAETIFPYFRRKRELQKVFSEVCG